MDQVAVSGSIHTQHLQLSEYVMSSFTSHENYSERHETFRNNSGMLIKNNELLRQHLPQVIQNILERKPLQRKFNILSVGSCTGQTDFQILKIVQEELKKKEDYEQVEIFNRAIEPNGHSLAIYKADFDEIPSLSKDERITLDFCKKTFEEYKDDNREDNIKFDIVHFVQCLYFVDAETALTHCMEKELTERGQMVCILGDKGMIHKVSLKQPIEQGVYTSHTPSEGSWMNVERMVEAFNEHGWKHEKFAQEYLMDVTDIFDEESKEGNLLLDFIMQVVNFRSSSGEEEVKETLERIKEAAVEKDGKRFVTRVDNMLIIRK